MIKWKRKRYLVITHYSFYKAINLYLDISIKSHFFLAVFDFIFFGFVLFYFVLFYFIVLYYISCYYNILYLTRSTLTFSIYQPYLLCLSSSFVFLLSTFYQVL